MLQQRDAAALQSPAASPGSAQQAAAAPVEAAQASAQAEITDEQRNALTVTSYDLQLQLTPAESRLNATARLMVRNDSARPLRKLALQLSSTLHWDGASVHAGRSAAQRVSLEQHRIDTDTDHTGEANEGIVELPVPLGAGDSLELVVLYSGTVEQSAARLVRAGQSIDAASAADWDRIGGEQVALRGFGHVLWYPVASSQAFLESGAQLAESVAAQARREQDATVRLRLEIEGGALHTAFFCGQSAPVAVVNAGMARGGEADGSDLPSISTAEWPTTTLGFGAPSLFLSTAEAMQAEGPVTVLAASADETARVQAAAKAALPLVTTWLGATRERFPVVLNHLGEPFAQRALLVEGAQEAATSFAMTHLESHAWFSSPEVWLDEGVAQLLPLVALEATVGRPAAIAQLRDLQPALSLADSSPGQGRSESLVHASREVTYRNKAVSVLWMLRTLVGDPALQAALQGLKQRPAAERTALELEHALEQRTGKNLQEFFRDWVLEDRSLPDLSIVSAIPRPVTGMPGRPDGNLVAVEVRNEGQVAADVPVSVHSGTLSATERLHIPAGSTASVRILFQGTPEVVDVNDGTVPEVGGSEHRFTFAAASGGSAPQ